MVVPSVTVAEAVLRVSWYLFFGFWQMTVVPSSEMISIWAVSSFLGDPVTRTYFMSVKKKEFNHTDEKVVKALFLQRCFLGLEKNTIKENHVKGGVF